MYVCVSFYGLSVGHHRYVSLLFRQEEEERAPTTKDAFPRSKFDVVAYADDHALHYVGLTDFYSKPAADADD